jgi:hypothetical protein
MEALLYKNPEVADMFLNNTAFREYLLSRLPPEDKAKAEKLAKEQNTTVVEVLKKKFVELLIEDTKSENTAIHPKTFY